jgi:hypothetical protein
MANNERDARGQLVQLLLGKVADDAYPSTTMLDLIEEMVTDEDRDDYIAVLWDKVRDDTYPSLALMTRLRDQAAEASASAARR